MNLNALEGDRSVASSVTIAAYVATRRANLGGIHVSLDS
jgi:hypothetical protein